MLSFLVYVTFLALLMDISSCEPSRVCPLGLYCPDDYSCEDSTKCVDSCYKIKATSQGNGSTGRCEDVSNSYDIWFDSSLYEVFVYRKLHQNEILKNVSLMVTYGFWENPSKIDEDFPNNVTFRLTSPINLTVSYLSTTFNGFKNRSIPEIVRNVSVISLSQNLMLGDYNMKIQAIWQDMEIAESGIIIHVVDPLPRALPVPVTCVQFESENYTVSSLDLSLSVTLTLSGWTQTEPFDVFVIAEDTLSADSQDFTPGWYRATFNPGATTATTNEIPILSRALDESIEQFSLELYIPSASYKIGIQSGAVKKAIANIKDVMETFAVVGEDINVPPFVHLTISCSDLISVLVPFNITWSVNGDLVTNNSVPNSTINDHLIITSTLLTPEGQFGSTGIYACTVCSDNGTCIERQSHFEICEVPRLEKAAMPITKIFSSTASTLQCGENLCISSNPSLNFTVMMNCILLRSVSTNDYEFNVYKDNLFYSNEPMINLTEEIIFDSLGMYKTVLNDSCGMDTATSVLSLCDMMSVYFSSTVFTGSESSGNVIVSMILVRNTIMNGEITVIVIPSPLSAQGNGMDYTSTPINATFPAGVNNTTVDIPVTVDNIVEENETFQVEIFIPVPAKYAVEPGNPSKASVTITDSSRNNVNFEQSTYSVYEDSGPVQLVLVLSDSSATNLTIRVKMFNQQTSATGGSDFIFVPHYILFPAGVERVTFNVTIIEDNILEHNESFSVGVDPLTLPSKVTIGSSSHTTITILNDDSLTVEFTRQTYTIHEDQGSLQAELILSSPSSYHITVTVLSTNGSATGEGIDYDSGPYNVTFSPGDTGASFDILISHDQIEEDIESFTISISPHLPPLVTHGDIIQATVVIINKNMESHSSLSVGLIAGISAGAFLFIVVTVFIIYCMKKNKSENTYKFTTDKKVTWDNKSYNNVKPVLNAINLSAIALDEWKKQMKAFLIDYNALKIEETIAKGEFGVVYKGWYTRKNRSSQEVAIKTSKDLSLSNAKEFIEECSIAKRFDHPNVLSLIGVSIIPEENTPLMIMPYMHLGDVRSFLKSKRGNTITINEFPKGLKHHTLMQMCLDVAKGMEYLSMKHFVHRDLAARNCMLDEYMVAKVADFGLSRDIYITDYYRLDHSAPLPVKWLSPEAIFDRVFTEKSDVWAFGVTCWEVFSLGLQPYPLITSSELGEYLRSGNVLDKPNLCSDEMYNIIKSCWIIKPEERPSFTALACSIYQGLPIVCRQVSENPSYLSIY